MQNTSHISHHDVWRHCEKKKGSDVIIYDLLAIGNFKCNIDEFFLLAAQQTTVDVLVGQHRNAAKCKRISSRVSHAPPY